MRSDLPALLGGAPIRPEGPPAWPLPDPDVHAALAEAIASGSWGKYHGNYVCAFETELATFHEVPHALTCASGTLAVEVALRTLRVGPGDEVVMAAYDYEPTFLTIHAIGAKPVLIDIHPHTWQLDPSKLEAALAPQTKAIVCSHLHGGVVPMREVMEIARRQGIGVVEDASQATGATVDGKPAGTWGDVGTLSFGGSKLLTAGRGGGLLFSDPQLYQRAKTWLHRGLQMWAPLSELQAAALRPQLRKLRGATRWRAERVRELLEALARLTPRVSLPEGKGETPSPSPLAGEGGSLGFESEPGEGYRHDESDASPLTRSLRSLPSPARGEGETNIPGFYKLGFQYNPASFGLSRELFVKALRAEGIAFDAGFKALHVGRSPSRFRAGDELTRATDAHERCITLYHPVLSVGAGAAPAEVTADVQQVAEAVAKVYRYRDRF